MTNILDEVMTFAEATRVLGKHASFLHDLAKSGKIKEGVHYRNCGGSRIILKSVVEGLKQTKIKIYKTVFEIQKMCAEFNEREVKKIEPGIILNEIRPEIEIMDEFHSKEEAMEELKKYKGVAKKKFIASGEIIDVIEYRVIKTTYETDENGDTQVCKIDESECEFAPISYVRW